MIAEADLRDSLTRALRCVLELEELYGGSGLTTAVDAAGGGALPAELQRALSTSAQDTRTASSTNEGDLSRLRARRMWLELDHVLCELSQPPLPPHAGVAADLRDDVDARAMQRIFRDVNRGRLDRWVHASSASDDTTPTVQLGSAAHALSRQILRQFVAAEGGTDPTE